MLEFFTLRGRLLRLEEEFEKLEAKHKNLEVEWLDTLDKVKRFMFRAQKDWQRIEQLETSRQDAPGSSQPGLPMQSPSPLIDPISAKILARRARILGKEPTQ